MLDALRDVAFGGFGRHLDDVALHVELPAVIEAAQPAFFVARVDERGAAVRAVFVEHAEPAFGVAEHHQVFAKQAYALGRAVGLGDFLGQTRRDPVPAHNLPHWGIALDAAEQIVFFRSHVSSRDTFLDIEASLMSGRWRVELEEP